MWWTSEYQRVTAPVSGSGPFYFAATGHTIAARFQDYWAQHGGLAQFGYPLTEERWDTLPNPSGGACCVTQYFERARFEWHPENEGTPYVILLGQFGRRILADNANLSGDFRPLYFSNGELRERLGAPRGPMTTSPGAALGFQRGVMLWHGDERRIYVFAADGRVLLQYAFRLSFDDTWKEGDPVGGGPARTEPYKFIPQRGFFTVWRENGPVFDALGYANHPNETGYTMRVQEFAGGLILTGEEGGVRDTYALFVQRTSNSGAPIVTWSRIFTETVGGGR
jgi:hypothetical protein